MIEQLGRRCALVMLASMSLATVMGLVAWGPILLSPEAHDYADSRAWLGIPSAANVCVNVAMLAVGSWGWCVTRVSAWPPQLRRPWQLFQACAVVSALLAAAYHTWPGDTLFVATHAATAGGFMMLTLGMLAERVHPRFGASMSCGLLLLGAAVLAGAVLIGRSSGNPLDMRPLLLLEIVPVLVIPAGALSLPGRATHARDWIVVLLLYAAAKLLEPSDALILQSSGWVSGHTLMHLALTAAVGWMAYCAVRARSALVPSDAAEESGDVSHRETSLKTAG